MQERCFKNKAKQSYSALYESLVKAGSIYSNIFDLFYHADKNVIKTMKKSLVSGDIDDRKFKNERRWIMANINNITILGNLTKDPELKFTQNGNSVASFGLAVNRKWKDLTGEWNEEVTFISVTVWNNLAENCAESLKKGDRVLVNGRLQMRTWETNGGQARSKIEIVANIIAASLEWANVEITKNIKGIKEEYDDEIPF